VRGGEPPSAQSAHVPRATGCSSRSMGRTATWEPEGDGGEGGGQRRSKPKWKKQRKEVAPVDGVGGWSQSVAPTPETPGGRERRLPKQNQRMGRRSLQRAKGGSTSGEGGWPPQCRLPPVRATLAGNAATGLPGRGADPRVAAELREADGAATGPGTRPQPSAPARERQICSATWQRQSASDRETI